MTAPGDCPNCGLSRHGCQLLYPASCCVDCLHHVDPRGPDRPLDLPECPHPIEGLSIVRLPPSSDDALVASGGWCAPISVTYDLRPATVDDIAWDGPDWNALVAPHLTALIAVRAEAKRRLRLVRYALADLRAAVLGREEDEWGCP